MEDPLVTRGVFHSLAKQFHRPIQIAVVYQLFPWAARGHEQQRDERSGGRQGQMPVSDESGRVPLQCSMKVNVSEGFHSRSTAPSTLPAEEP